MYYKFSLLWILNEQNKTKKYVHLLDVHPFFFFNIEIRIITRVFRHSHQTLFSIIRGELAHLILNNRKTISKYIDYEHTLNY